jgi:formylglycine-generating enzyme required for sulfatase activity
MATWQTVGRWAAVLAVVALLAATGSSSEPGASAPTEKAEAPAVAKPADEAVPAWAKVSQSQIDSARKIGVPVAKELDLGGGVTMKLALIPAGKFMMGEVEDQHEVTLSKPFYMGVTDVTQAQYEAVIGTNPSQFKGPTNPVEMVSWDDAAGFCKKLSEKARQAVRLPTEAEWEYACRAGTKTHFCFGDAEEGLGDYAWYDANSGRTTHPVGQKKPNAWGLYDVHGNVWQWCADWYGDYPKGAVTDPQGAVSGSRRVQRGGCWIDNSDYCRVACRFWDIPGYRDYVIGLGFRVVVSLAIEKVKAPAAAKPVDEAVPAPTEKAEAPAVAKPADGAVPVWAKVSQLQTDSARKAGVLVAKELDLGGGVTMKLVFIPAGKFMMGSPESEKGREAKEGPQHEVTLSKPFYMGVTEVTQAQYQAVIGSNPSQFEGPTNPVEMVSWDDGAGFCKKLSEKARQAVRLPTEAEWEYACRAGTKTRFCFGDADEGLGDYAWYSANSEQKTHPVGQKKPNAWGLYDVHGNVWQWCADWYGDYPKGAVTDPQGTASGSQRVLRGGSWISSPGLCRAAHRYRLNPDYRYDIYGFGFRVVVSLAGVDLK